MRAEAASSRLQAPSTRANGTSSPITSTAASATSKRGSGGSLVPPPLPTYGYGLRRPTASTSSVTSSTASSSTRQRTSEEKTKASVSPPKLALHELQSSLQSTPPPTSSYLKRGSGRTIATLGNPSVSTPPTSQTSVRRVSGSPARQPNATPTRQRSRHSSLKTEDQRRSPQYGAKAETQTQMQASGFSSPEPYLRQRKRSADMMELQAQLGVFRQDNAAFGANGEALTPAVTNGNGQAKREDEEMDEPSLLTLDDDHNGRGLPTTPPRRSSAEANFYGDGLPVSPPDSKRLKRLTRSPKTPLGISTYAPTDSDGLSATQRVRLSLSGYMTVASLTGQGSKERKSLGGSEAVGLLMSASNKPATSTATTPAPSVFPSETESKFTTPPQQASRSVPGSLNQSTSSQKRSKFAASRSQSGPAQVATALLPTKHSVDCLMGYIRELQLSEATLRLQVEKTRKQKHDELSRSMLRVNSLETTMSHMEMQRERQRKELEEHQQMIQELTSEVTQLREYFARQAQYEQQQQHTQPHEAHQSYEASAAYGGDVYFQQPSQNDQVPSSAQNESNAMAAADQNSSTQTSEANYGYHVDQPSHLAPSQFGETALDQDAGYYAAEYQDYQQGETTSAPAGAEWSDQQQALYDHSYDYSQEYPTQEYPQQGDFNNGPARYESPTRYATPTQDTTPQPPLSPVASPEAVWNARATAAASAPTIDRPPPMFRIAPRLSDIISPLARSGAAGVAAAADHNVLKPVTTEALANTPEERGRKQQRGKNTAATMAPPRPTGSVGPPVFSMGDISSTFEPVPRLPTPPPTSRDSTGYLTPEQPSRQTHFDPIPDGPANIEDEQFVPATQFFKPFQKPSPASRKASPPSSEASPVVTKVPLDKLLIDFFTTVDKQKLRMVQGYAKRYKGHEEKLFVELTKRYGAEKVAALKHKFEHGVSPPQQLNEPAASPVVFMTPPPPPSRTRGPILSPQSLRVDSTSSLSPDIQAPLSPEAGGSGIFAAESPAQPFLMSAASFDGSPSGSFQTEHSTVSASPFSPPPKGSSPAHKVSPNGGRRRGPPLPFSFDEATTDLSEDMLPAIPPPPVVSVVGPPPLPPLAPAETGPATPSRLAPSPPREPPPRSRSPVRNVGIVRQRVSPQSRRQQSESRDGIVPPPLAARGLTPPNAQNGKLSPVQPVTLESLLSELYRKHQRDQLKNVPAVVKEYTGKERELVAQLKQRYGALSVKKLELNLETLVQQGGGARASTPAVASPLATRSSSPTTAPVKKRGWIRRLVGLVIKLLLIRFVVLLLAFGGLVTVNHIQCGKEAQEASTTTDAGLDCSSLQEGVDSFDYTRLIEYAQRVESRECFCDKWATQEKALWLSPSLTSSFELATLTPFSRTIAEPAFFYFVDTYLPDLPWSTYYESYGEPVGRATKGYYVVYLKPAAHVVKEYYEVYAKAGVQVGKEYAAVGYGHAKVAYAEISVVVTDLWAQLVEMYNEEGAQAAVRHEQPTKGEVSGVASTPMDEALTKAAMASKALAEPSETETVEDSHASDESEDVKTDQLPDVETEPTVEIAVEQTDVNLDYTSAVPLQVEATQTTEEPESVDSPRVDVSATVDDIAPPADDVAETVEEASEVVGVADDVSVEEADTVIAEDISVLSEAAEQVVSDTPHESVVDSEVQASHGRSEDIASAQVAEEVADEALETVVPEPVPEATQLDDAVIQVNEDIATVEVEPEITLPQEDESVTEPVQTGDEVVETEAVEVVDVDIEVAGEIVEVEQTEVLQDVAPEVAVLDAASNESDGDTVADKDRPSESVEIDDVGVSDSIPIAEDPVNHSEATSTSDESPVDAFLTTTQPEEETSAQELAVLEDLAGLDPLEMLDMADLAAAELVTVQ